MDFFNWANGCLIDMGTLSGAIWEADFEKTKQIAPQKILKGGPPPDFQIMVANGLLETPLATTERQFYVDDTTFVECFIV